MCAEQRVVYDFERASALVFGGLGFKASIIRGVVTGLNLLAGYPFPYRTFADADTAVVFGSVVDVPMVVTP